MESCRWLIVGLVFSTLSQSGLAQEKLSRVQMEEDLKQLFAVTRRAYAYVDEKKEQYGVDLDAMQAEALKRLDTVKSNGDFRDLLKEVMAGLKDGHCEVYADHLIAPKPRAWPFLLSFVKEGVLVTGFDKSLAGSGIELGDVLKEVNGRPIKDWINEAARTVSASTDGARRRIALQRMIATADESVKVKVEHVDGTSAVLTVQTGPNLRLPAEPNLADPPEGKFAAGRVLKHEVGYIRVPSFGWETPERHRAKTDAEADESAKPARDQIDAAFEAVADTRGLVLDLRGNAGGWDVLGAYLLSHLLPGDFRYYSTQTRSSPDLRQIDKSPYLPRDDGWAPKWDWIPRKTTFSYFKRKVYTGRMIVLINENCFSATDCIAAALTDLHPNVRFVGRPTNGGSGGPTGLAELKHSKAHVQLCVMRVWSPKGRLIEGHGTRPDVPVQWTREDVLKGRDADLEAALKDLRR
jgi:C-terminal processing protease CtpA/Prc